MDNIGKLAAMKQQLRGKRPMPGTALSDDSILVKKIVAEHKPDGLEYDAKPLLHIVEDILRRATLSTEGVSSGALAHVDQVEDVTHHPGYTNMLEALSFKIDRIACEISYKSLAGVDAHSRALVIFDMLQTYEWDVKLVLSLAAFALKYGRFWLLADMQLTNQLARSMANLKKVLNIKDMEHVSMLRPRFEALNELVKVILEAARCVIKFNGLPRHYIAQDTTAYNIASNHIPIATYWSVRGIIACATLLASLDTLGFEFMQSTTESWELSTLAHKLKNILEHLRKNLDSCYRQIEKRMDSEAYEMLRELFTTPHIDNMKVLKALISAKDDTLPLYDGATKKRVSLEPLRRKNVLLLISGLEFSHDELLILEQIYNESRAHTSSRLDNRYENRYELVWIPILDLNEGESTQRKQRQFEELQLTMPWFSVYHPSVISKPVIWFIQREWKYKNKPILVVLDPQGRVACPNAIHMMWIWGSAAFPFTSAREEALWKEETWRLELLVDGIDSEILNWIKDDKFIFLYGGNDPDWVRKFVREARRVAVASQINLEMVYVGKSNKSDQVQKVLDTISREKLPSHSWQEHSMIWFFWTRLESMLFSKIQLKQADDDSDLVMQEVKRLLSYDKMGGWIVLARGSRIIVNGHANTGLQTLMEYEDIWRVHAERDGFEPGFRDHYGKLHAVDNPCCRFEFSHAMGRIPEKLRCPECRRYMHMLTTFQCCHDETVDEAFLVSALAPPTI
ncbi:hypothetical protein S83_056153 [Arachis hypogaea]